MNNPRGNFFPKYIFQDTSIGFYEHQIDLLRNGYNYGAIEYNNVRSIIFKRGMMKNWILLLAFGMSLLVIAALIVIHVHSNSESDNFIGNLLIFWKGTRGFGIMAVLFLIAFGLYCCIDSVKKTIKVVIETNDDRKQFEITNIYKDNKLDELYEFLKDRVPEISVNESY